jgi:hypothetical protein
MATSSLAGVGASPEGERACGAFPFNRWVRNGYQWRTHTQARAHAQDLDELGEGVRRYRIETQRTTVEGRPVVVTHRLCKWVRDGRWETSMEIEHIEPFEDSAASAS